MSAKNSQGVEESFHFLVEKILQKIEKNEIDPKNEFGIKIGGNEPGYLE